MCLTFNVAEGRRHQPDSIGFIWNSEGRRSYSSCALTSAITDRFSLKLSEQMSFFFFSDSPCFFQRGVSRTHSTSWLHWNRLLRNRLLRKNWTAESSNCIRADLRGRRGGFSAQPSQSSSSPLCTSCRPCLQALTSPAWSDAGTALNLLSGHVLFPTAPANLSVNLLW